MILEARGVKPGAGATVIVGRLELVTVVPTIVLVTVEVIVIRG